MGPKKLVKNNELVTPAKNTSKGNKSASKGKTVEKSNSEILNVDNTNPIQNNLQEQFKEPNSDKKLLEKPKSPKLQQSNISNNAEVFNNSNIRRHQTEKKPEEKVSFLEITKFLKPSKIVSTSISPNSKFLNRMIEANDDQLKNNSFSQKFLPNAIERKDRKLSLQNDYFKSDNPEGNYYVLILFYFLVYSNLLYRK